MSDSKSSEEQPMLPARFAGISVNDLYWKCILMNEKCEITHLLEKEKPLPKEFESIAMFAKELTIFLKDTLTGNNLQLSHVTNLGVGIDSLFEYGEEYKNQLTDILRDETKIPTIVITCLEARVYVKDFPGVALKADFDVSAAVGTQDAQYTLDERGYMLRSVGSAYWIGNECLYQVYNVEEGLETSEFDLSAVKRAIYEYYEISKPVDILKSLYVVFSKYHVGRFYQKTGELANKGDAFCKHLWEQAGFHLGVMFGVMLTRSQYCHVVDGTAMLLTTGRVWDFYELLRHGLIKGLLSQVPHTRCGIEKVIIYGYSFGDAYAAAVASAGKEKLVLQFSDIATQIATINLRPEFIKS